MNVLPPPEHALDQECLKAEARGDHKGRELLEAVKAAVLEMIAADREYDHARASFCSPSLSEMARAAAGSRVRTAAVRRERALQALERAL